MHILGFFLIEFLIFCSLFKWNSSFPKSYFKKIGALRLRFLGKDALVPFQNPQSRSTSVIFFTRIMLSTDLKFSASIPRFQLFGWGKLPYLS